VQLLFIVGKFAGGGVQSSERSELPGGW
jgi:hypothetical protein